MIKYLYLKPKKEYFTDDFCKKMGYLLTIKVQFLVKKHILLNFKHRRVE